MSTIQRKPPIKARNYQKRADTISKNHSLIGIEDVSTPDLFLAPVNNAVSTFDGFFGEKPNQLSLTYELCSAYSNPFINTSQYLWGPKAAASLLKTIQEIMSITEFDESQGEENKKYNKQILKKAGEELYKELENREMINNNMLIGNLLGMVSS